MTDTTITVADSKLGWAKALKELIGHVVYWSDSTMGFVQGPSCDGHHSRLLVVAHLVLSPLESLFNFAVNIFKNAPGRKLSSIECHDLVCKIAEVVVVGGVRRSALISLSNLSDDRMRHKSGQWWNDNGQRALANNSACYTENQISVSLWMSGRHYTSPSLVNVVSSIVRVQTSKQTRMVVGLLKDMSLVLILVQRLFYVA